MSKVFLCLFLTCQLFFSAVHGSEGVKIGDLCEAAVCEESITNAVCDVEEKKCLCQVGYMAAPNKTACLEFAGKIGEECEISEQCQHVPSTVCLNGTCSPPIVESVPTTTDESLKEECNEKVKCSKGVCVRGFCVEPAPMPTVPAFPFLGQACANDSDCKISQSHCVEYRCLCVNNFVSSQNLRSCLPIAKSLGDECTESVQCVSLNGSVCMNLKCTEKMTSFLKNTHEPTVLLLGSSCQTNEECKNIANAICNENICECIETHVTSVTSNSCLPKVKKEGDPCEVDQQCLNLKGATCSNNKCVKMASFGKSLHSSAASYRKLSEVLIVTVLIFLKILVN